ncbi:DUF3306 domain-containing protein [Roseovarius sp. MMSF_3281]|uniref:DUF3306 domain-containing protein n=1 Tax=Roseovarius sp. MMSF_3281 TaxID=3046694 RepID=UPI00273D2466|nr:DUF3306 domain-containing protein [Roseovarius sp. MMSF_3281]
MSRRSDFWSRRKAKVLEEQQDDLRAAEARDAAARDAALEEKSDEEVLEDLGLPDPDTLELGDDFKAFMAKAVPDRIRRRALRRLWLSNPALSNLDGLLDYGEDFTDGATVVENLQTAYQVGKGMLKHVEELARQAEAQEQAEEAPVLLDADEETGVYAVEDEHEIAPENECISEPCRTDVEAEEEPSYQVPPRRRMRFSFDAKAGAQA